MKVNAGLAKGRNRVDEWERHLLYELEKAHGTIGDLTLRLRLPRSATSYIGPAARSLVNKGVAERVGKNFYLAGTASRQETTHGGPRSSSEVGTI
jgi:hypothetical protein